MYASSIVIQKKRFERLHLILKIALMALVDLNLQFEFQFKFCATIKPRPRCGVQLVISESEIFALGAF